MKKIKINEDNVLLKRNAKFMDSRQYKEAVRVRRKLLKKGYDINFNR